MNELLFGKSNLKRIVGLEVHDDYAEVFTQTEDGKLDSQFIPNRYWILTHNPKDSGWIKLEGDLYYNYGKQYVSKDDFLADRNHYKKKHQDIYSIYNSKEALMVKDGLCYFQGMKFEEPSVLSFDIETTSLHYTNKDTLLLISNTFQNGIRKVRKLFAYTEYNSQGEMIEAWCNWVREMDPSIICGHNIVSFDLPYIDAVARRFSTSLSLGRDNSVLSFERYESKFRKDQLQDITYKKAHVYGREIIDTYFLAIKYDIVEKKYDSYGLKQIIKQEGLKESNRVFYDASQIRFKYKDKDEWEKIKAYCEFDADDSLKLYNLMAPPFFYMAQNIPKSYQQVIESASGSQLNSILVRAYLQNRHSIPKTTEITQFQGAVSFAIPGLYKNVFKLDIKSMYPSIIRNDKLYDRNKDPRGYFLELTNVLTEQRFEQKRLADETGQQYYRHIEQSNKILINSLYGLTNTSGLNFNSPMIGAEITRRGREILNKAIVWSTGKETSYWFDIFKEKTQ